MVEFLDSNIPILHTLFTESNLIYYLLSYQGSRSKKYKVVERLLNSFYDVSMIKLDRDSLYVDWFTAKQFYKYYGVKIETYT